MSKNEAVFTTLYKKIELPSYNTQLIIQPFGDVHRDSPNCAVEKWKRSIDWMKKEHNPNTYYLPMGDLNDFASKSEREILINQKLHESTRKNIDDAMALKPISRIAGEISFMKPNLLGCLEGNHFWQFDTGQTSTQILCDRLGCKWLGDICYIRLAIHFKNRTCYTIIDIIAAHGRAGGKLAGTTINQVDDLKRIFPNADLYLEGHDHHRGAFPTSVLEAHPSANDELNIKQKRQWLGRTGSFLKGYVEGEQSYVVKRLLKPTDIGIIRFMIDFKRIRNDGRDIIIKDIHCWS